jgi:hypothetical protein
VSDENLGDICIMYVQPEDRETQIVLLLLLLLLLLVLL